MSLIKLATISVHDVLRRRSKIGSKSKNDPWKVRDRYNYKFYVQDEIKKTLKRKGALLGALLGIGALVGGGVKLYKNRKKIN